MQGTDLRLANLSNAVLVGTQLARSNLQGSLFRDANMQSAGLASATLTESDLDGAQLQSAYLFHAHLNKASLTQTGFQGAILRSASFANARIESTQFQAADLRYSNLQRVKLFRADLRGANLSDSNLQLALFKESQLQGAVLANAGLQGADFVSSDARAASFKGSRLQGSTFSRDTQVALTNFAESYLWRATADCAAARVINPRLEPVVGYNHLRELMPANREGIEAWIQGATSDSPEEDKNSIAAELREKLDPTQANSEAMAAWQKCAEHAAQEAKYDAEVGAYLAELACATGSYAGLMVENLIVGIERGQNSAILKVFASNVLTQDGALCSTVTYSDPVTKQLRDIVSDVKP